MRRSRWILRNDGFGCHKNRLGGHYLSYRSSKCAFFTIKNRLGGHYSVHHFLFPMSARASALGGHLVGIICYKNRLGGHHASHSPESCETVSVGIF